MATNARLTARAFPLRHFGAYSVPSRRILCGSCTVWLEAVIFCFGRGKPDTKQKLWAHESMKTKRIVISVVASLLLALGATAQRQDAGTQVIERIEAKRQAYADVALQIWRYAETGFQEVKSSALLEEKLAEAGFSVQKGVAGIPTAFVASYGS